MSENLKIHFIHTAPKLEKRVAVYARVSTNDAEQLKSLTAQVSAFTRLVVSTPQWRLVDIYIDIASSKTGSSRKEFNRILEDCKAHKIEIILTKNIMLSNEKYTGTVRLLNSGKHEMQNVSENNNPAIISSETFQAVQIEKVHRSNATQVADGKQRKNERYSSKM